MSAVFTFSGGFFALAIFSLEFDCLADGFEFFAVVVVFDFVSAAFLVDFFSFADAVFYFEEFGF